MDPTVGGVITGAGADLVVVCNVLAAPSVVEGVLTKEHGGRSGAAAPDGPDPDIEALYRRERAGMVRLATLLTGVPSIAEELVQDAFISVHRNWDRALNPPGYLRTAVVNAARSYHRREFRDHNRPTLAERVQVDAEYDEMWDELAQLNPRQRTALVLRYYEDLSILEIAETLGCRPGTVKSLIHRGLARLKELVPDA